MIRLIEEIILFLESEGFECSRQMRDGAEVIRTHTLDRRHPKVILPMEISASSALEAAEVSDRAYECVQSIGVLEDVPLIITEDRWRAQESMMRARLLAHLEIFSQAFARNCEVRRIEKTEARDFLTRNHSYGYAACRYHYGLFLKRQTGHLAASLEDKESSLAPGTLIAVATFSNARKWSKGDRVIKSYEWTRYASLPDLRVSGGMGKMLKTFINDVHPDDIMSYADLEWSRGDVYSRLGFVLEGQKEPVLFSVDPRTWERTPVKPGTTAASGGHVIPGSAGNLFFRNFGSNKYRMKLTDYE
jgi:hypothetical protein